MQLGKKIKWARRGVEGEGKGEEGKGEEGRREEMEGKRRQWS